MTDDVLVRPFRRADERDVRRICLDNGRLPERVRPADWIFQDYWTRYYTRWEPRHVWVAERDGHVAGYLTAAFDTRMFRRTMKRRILPRLLVLSAFTGALAEPRSRNFLLRRIALWHRPEPDPAGLLETHPAHLHVNLEAGARGSGLGRRLMACFEADARRAGLPGVHLETLADNADAVAFFAAMGFTELARRHPLARIDPALKDRAVLLLGKRL